MDIMVPRYFVLLIILLLTCCRPSSSSTAEAIDSVLVFPEANAFGYMDTTMVFEGIVPGKQPPVDTISRETVTTILNNHFRKLGYYIHGEIPDKADEGNLVVIYDRHTEVHLNPDQMPDAFVFYWLIPPGGTGTCFRPHSAMIVSSGNNYSLAYPDFIDSGLSVDSITANGTLKLYCSHTPCSGGTKRIAVTLSDRL